MGGTSSEVGLSVSDRNPRRAITVDDTLTATSPTDVSDVATYRVGIRSSARLASTGTRPTSLRWESEVDVSVESTKGEATGCSSSGGGEASLDAAVSVERPTLAYLTSRVTGSIRAGSSVFGGSGRFVSTDADSTGTQRAAALLLPYETAFVMASASSRTGTGFPGETFATTRSGTHRVEVSFVVAGIARSAARGRGAAFARFADARVCPGSLNFRFTDRAIRVRRAVVLLDGRRVKVIRAPTTGQIVRLNGLPATIGARLVVDLTLDNGTTRGVSRSYAPCDVPGDGGMS